MFEKKELILSGGRLRKDPSVIVDIAPAGYVKECHEEIDRLNDKVESIKMKLPMRQWYVTIKANSTFVLREPGRIPEDAKEAALREAMDKGIKNPTVVCVEEYI